MDKNEIKFIKVFVPIKDYISIVKPPFVTKMLGTSTFNLLNQTLKVTSDKDIFINLIGYNNNEVLLENVKNENNIMLFNHNIDNYLIEVEVALKDSLKNLNYYEQLNLFNNGKTNPK